MELQISHSKPALTSEITVPHTESESRDIRPVSYPSSLASLGDPVLVAAHEHRASGRVAVAWPSGVENALFRSSREYMKYTTVNR